MPDCIPTQRSIHIQYFSIWCQQSRPENRGYVSFVLWAAVFSAPLWLWYASCEVCADCSGKFKAQVPRWEWKRAAAESPDGCQHGQVSATGRATVWGDTQLKKQSLLLLYIRMLYTHFVKCFFLVALISTGYNLRFISWRVPAKTRLWSSAQGY